MSAPMNMAKRAAAGTLALAVCLSGGALVFAGAANALPGASDITTTPGTSTVAAPQVTRAAAQALADTTVTLGTSSWSTGDHVIYQLPAGVVFNGTPTVTAVKVSGSGTTAPTVAVAALATADDPSTTVAGPTADPVAAARQIEIKFTNSKGAIAADSTTSWKLVVSGIKVDVATGFTPSSIVLGGSASTVSATTDTNGKVYGETYDSNAGTYGTTVLYTSTSTPDVLGYVEKASISVPTGFSYVNGGGVQAAPSITLTESQAAAISAGTVTLGFQDAAGTAVKLDDSSLAIGGDTFAPTLSVNGTAVTTGTFTSNGTGDSLSTPGGAITWTSSADTVVVGNLRFADQVTAFVGPIKAVLSGTQAASVANSVTGYLVKSGTVAINGTTRTGGATRYDTAAQLVNTAFPTSSHYTKFVLAGGDGAGVDALSANYVAGSAANQPLILTSSSGLSSATLAYLVGAMPTSAAAVTFTVMGGKTVIPDSVIDDIKDAFPASSGWRLSFNRNAGADRYETAADAAINLTTAPASYTDTYASAAVKTAILASGENPADAVVAGGVAYQAKFPLLLTQAGSLPDSTATALGTLGIKQVVIVGGTSAVSSSVETTLTGMGIKVIRKSGATRYDTAVALADWARAPKASPVVTTNGGLGYDGASNSLTPTWTPVPAYLGNGNSFADVLAAGQLAGAASATFKPVLTTDGASLSSPTSTWLTTHHDDITTITALGGSAAVTDSTITAAINAAS